MLCDELMVTQCGVEDKSCAQLLVRPDVVGNGGCVRVWQSCPAVADNSRAKESRTCGIVIARARSPTLPFTLLNSARVAASDDGERTFVGPDDVGVSLKRTNRIIGQCFPSTGHLFGSYPPRHAWHFAVLGHHLPTSALRPPNTRRESLRTT